MLPRLLLLHRLLLLLRNLSKPRKRKRNASTSVTTPAPAGTPAPAAAVAPPPVPPFFDPFEDNDDHMTTDQVAVWCNELLDIAEADTSPKKRTRETLRERAEVIVNYLADLLKRSVKRNERKMVYMQCIDGSHH